MAIEQWCTENWHGRTEVDPEMLWHLCELKAYLGQMWKRIWVTAPANGRRRYSCSKATIFSKNIGLWLYLRSSFFIIIIMFVKTKVRSLFLNPQSGVGPSISSSVVQCSVFLLVCISVPVLAVYLCPSSVRVLATFSGTVLFPGAHTFPDLRSYGLHKFFYVYCHTAQMMRSQHLTTHFYSLYWPP